MTDRLDVNAATADPLDAVPGVAGHGHEIVRYCDGPERFAGLRHLDEVPSLSDEVDDTARECLSVD